MARKLIFAIASAALLTGCISPSRDFQGYVADDRKPAEVEPGEDTRSSVLADLGSPSTSSVFDENTWFYISATRERFTFFRPSVATRDVVAIRFGEDDVVEEVLHYDEADGRIIDYASRETPTRGRELGLLEQIFGNVGRVALPQQETAPGDIGRQ